ncbi:hypothetical protein [Flavilitoribacter nigricans]|uniref:Uncharacterized protein n=1 Tax=Flavilitoribacter nigricans (strain ATCC 23147 / DSM 23189 / NBRC 102662 / NCIMB 1420 / SS-2) TaxID=1122177 RepID=A0A2D0NDY3_FLAN2|nr:hypothetical protein [Flavilitoribacter nigricans]PHN06721.1 hypothetical protein CRP01_10520 [Flavilitoribacter nigricans DSM 23189 = NBRC 102662]
MNTNRIIKLLTVFCVFWLISCNSGKKSDSASDCKTQGTVQDFTGMDGCRLLIVTEDGKKLLPGSILDSDFVLEAGQEISFDYRPVDMMSVCMTEDQIVEITCIKLK